MTADSGREAVGRDKAAMIGNRVWLLLLVVALAGLDLAAKAVAEARLGGSGVDLGPVDLRLAYNAGVAFGLGGRLPSWTVIAVTAVITAVIGGYGWRAAPAAALAARLAGAAILAGAVANLVDRAGDGVVTDYLHTGWWPTFNLADTMLSLGVITLVLTAATTRGTATTTAGRPPAATDPAARSMGAAAESFDGRVE